MSEATNAFEGDRIKLQRPTTYAIDPQYSEAVLLGYVIGAMKSEGFTADAQNAFISSVVASINTSTHTPTFVSREEFLAKARFQVSLCNEHLLGRIPQEIKEKYNL